VNVSPEQIAQYVRNQGLAAPVRVNGNRDVLMLLLSNGIPVIAEQWINDYGGMGHYRLVIGYNRTRGTVTFDDSYYGPDRSWSWAEFEARWLEYNTNRIYIPVYRPEQEPVVRAILGEDASDAQMWLRAEAGARTNLQVFSHDARVWFALGDALLHQGRPADAVKAYEEAYRLGLPYRYYWYQFGHFEALAQVGDWQRILEISGPVLETAPMHEEMYYYRGMAYQNLGDTNAARDQYNQAIANNRNFAAAREALRGLN
jgi:tetratricopeptide (TPR) repeat protein